MVDHIIKIGLIDFDGNVILNPQFDDLTHFNNDRAIYKINKDMTSGIIDNKGKILYSCDSCELKFLNHDTFLLNTYHMFYGIYAYIKDKNGNDIVDFTCGLSYEIYSKSVFGRGGYYWGYYLIIDTKDNKKTFKEIPIYDVFKVVESNDLILIKSSNNDYNLFDKYGNHILKSVTHSSIHIMNRDTLIVDNRLVCIGDLKINYNFIMSDDNDKIVTFDNKLERDNFEKLYNKKGNIVNLMKIKKKLYQVNRKGKNKGKVLTK